MVRLHKHIPRFVTTSSGRVINFEVDSSDTITNIAKVLSFRRDLGKDL